MTTQRALRTALAALLLATATAACQGGADQPPLAGASIGGPFELIDQDGRRVTQDDYAGRYRLMYFGFANCPDICPTDLQVIGAGLRQFEASDPERAARVQPIFVTVDPARDTPQVLKGFVANFHPRLIGLTGSEQQIEAMKRAYRVYSSRGETTAGGGYNVDHLRVIMLMGPEGNPIALIPHEQGAAGVAAELERWVR